MFSTIFWKSGQGQKQETPREQLQNQNIYIQEA